MSASSPPPRSGPSSSGPPSATSGTGPTRDDPSPSPSATARARIVGGALLAGVGVGAVGVTVGALLVGLAVAADTGFLVGTLAFGFGLVGWAGSVVAGRGMETMQARLDGASDWTEADSRRAMARVGGFGFGLMLAAAVVGTALGYG